MTRYPKRKCFACGDRIILRECSCCCRWFCIGCMEEDRRCEECAEANKEETSEQEGQ